MGKLGALLLVVALSLGANSAVAKGPPPPATASASLTQTGIGPCPEAATVTWKNIKALVTRIDYTWFFSGTQAGGTLSNVPPQKTGSDVETGLPPVPAGANFSFTANLYSDLGGTNLVASVVSDPTPDCKV